MTKDNFYITLLIFLFIVLTFIFSRGDFLIKDTPCGNYQTEEVKIGEKTVVVEIADNDCKRIQGLSGRKYISDNSGMLFLFENEGRNGIWMKNMNFPLDIVWIDGNEKIVLLEKNILPETYPKVFGEELDSKYVIEVPSGFLEKNNIKRGDSVLILKD